MASKILIIDDERFFIDPVSLILTKYGYEVIFATDGISGLNKARTENPDLILLDLMLPNINGYQICSLLKLDSRYNNMPVIIVSARDTEAIISLVDKCNADMMMVNPIDVELLLEKISTLLKEDDAEE